LLQAAYQIKYLSQDKMQFRNNAAHIVKKDENHSTRHAASYKIDLAPLNISPAPAGGGFTGKKGGVKRDPN